MTDTVVIIHKADKTSPLVNLASFVIAVQKLANSKLTIKLDLEWDVAEKDQLLNHIPRSVLLEKMDSTAHPGTPVFHLSGMLLFTPEALCVAVDALALADYVSGYDAPTQGMVNLFTHASRAWKLPGSMNQFFVARLGTLTQDDTLLKDKTYADPATWALLHLLHKRKCASPLPAIWQIDGQPPSPNIPWAQVQANAASLLK